MTIVLAMVACDRPQDTGSSAVRAYSAYRLTADLAFLRDRGPVQVLTTPSGGQVALSAQYQGRVMTSAVSPDGISLGWVNREFIEAGRTGTQFDNYGGEDRFWLGPEAGQYGLYFSAGAPFELPAWRVPSALQEGTWAIKEQSDSSVTYTRPMHVVNYSGTQFDLVVERTVRVLSTADVTTHVGVSLPGEARWVGFETINRVTNSGTRAWTKDRGLPSVWILGMLDALGGTTVIIPFVASAGGTIVNDRYFGKVPEDRLKVEDGYLLFTADGKYRSKIGIGPSHARPLMGSYSPAAQVLTIVQFNQPSGVTDYVNSMWEHQERPYSGDVVNSYNDGPPNPGGWYELESSSPALALRPGDAYTHVHRTLHVVAMPEVLDALAAKALTIPAGAIIALQGSRSQ